MKSACIGFCGYLLPATCYQQAHAHDVKRKQRTKTVRPLTVLIDRETAASSPLPYHHHIISIDDRRVQVQPCHPPPTMCRCNERTQWSNYDDGGGLRARAASRILWRRVLVCCVLLQVLLQDVMCMWYICARGCERACLYAIANKIPIYFNSILYYYYYYYCSLAFILHTAVQ